MPIAALLVDDVKELKKYKQSPNGENNSWLIPCEKKQALIIIVYPIMYVFEWQIFNGLYRMMMKRGLKKAGYTGEFRTVNRMELVRMLLAENG